MKLLKHILFLILLLFLLFAMNIRLKAQITADFSCNDSIGCDNLFVNFVDKTVGTGDITYYWDFGNGNSSSEKNPTAYYSKSGIYEVKLVVHNDLLEIDSIIKTNYIKVYDSPKVGINVIHDTLGCVPFLVEFQPEITLGDTAIKQVIWDFGDNNSSLDSAPTHIYNNKGLYNVSILIRDFNGCEVVDFEPDYISVKAPPKPDFSSDVSYSCYDTLTVLFTNHLSDQSNLDFFWDFGDGDTLSAISPSHLYQGFDNYDVMLRVKDQYSCTDSIIKKSSIVLAETNRDIKINSKVYCRLDTLEIENNSSVINNYHWDFGDGTVSNQENPIKIYMESGSFNVNVITSFNGVCVDTLREVVNIDPIEAAYSTNSKYICQLPYNVNYIDESINSTSWLWKFGNGKVSTDKNPVNILELTTYLEEEFVKYYTDTLIVTSDNSCVDTLIVDSSVYVYLPHLYYTPNDSSHYDTLISGCFPLTVDFTNYSRATHPTDIITTYKWDFGEGDPVYGYNSSHTYNAVGEYNVAMTAINQSGCLNKKEVTVKVGKPLTAEFSYIAEDSTCGSEQVLFFDESEESGLVDSWFWKFSDGGSSYLKDPKYLYLDTGYVDAKLEVSYNGCKGIDSEIEKTNITYVKGPAGNFSYSFSCSLPLTYTFKQNIIDPDYIKWDFGDGQVDSTIQLQVEHTYDTTNKYFPSVYAVNEVNNCELTSFIGINVCDVDANINISNNVTCLEDSVFFYANNSIDADYFKWNNKTGKYLWTVDDTIEMITSDLTHGYRFLSQGINKVKLTIRGVNGCYDHVDTTIKVYKPIVDFLMIDSAGCIPFLPQMQNRTLSDTAISKWVWEFGTGAVDSTFEPNYVITDTGRYDISLKAFDLLGCSDTLIKAHTITASYPIPSIKVNNSILCLHDSIQFSNQSKGIGIIANWDFGDGNVSSLFSPKHAFSGVGLQTVTVHMVDSLGCDTTVVLKDIVDVKDLPVANCMADAYNSSCYPMLISFIDNSQGDSIKSWSWDFGDESESSGSMSPLHTYYKPGLYDIELVVTDINNCKDNIIKYNMIEVGGPYADIYIDDTVCKGVAATLELVNAINVENVQWLFPDGSTSDQVSLKKEFYDFGRNSIVINLMSDNVNTCNKMFRDTVTIEELTSNYIVSDTNGCVPLMLNFENTSIGEGRLSWFVDGNSYDSLQVLQYTYDNSGVFYPKLVVYNEFGCSDSSNVKIEVFSLPDIKLSNDTLICEGDTIALYVSGGENYKWYPYKDINDTIAAHPLVYPDSTIIYTIEVTDTNYCVDSSKVQVEVQNIPIAKVLNNDTVLIVGDELELRADQHGGNDFFWISDNNIECDGCLTTYVMPLKETIFYFVVVDEEKCFEIKDSVSVGIDYKYSIDMPNAFTPNNDGVNDIIKVKGWGIQEVLEFSVYNSNNKLVFKTDDKEIGWDGTDNNEELPQGVYYYYVKVLGYDNNVRDIKGSIFLMK